jgi:hypothetical protein
MNGSVVQALIRSDWRRHRVPILLSTGAGGLSLGLLQIGGEAAVVIGATSFFIALIVFGSMLPVSNIVNERKKQTLPFLMSLPLSAAQYTAAKMVSTVGMFLGPWLTLLGAALLFVLGRRGVPDGLVPLVLILCGATLVGFAIIAAMAMISESEGWTIAATIVSNSSYGFVWYFLIRNPVLRKDMGAPEPVWSTLVLTVLAVEIGVLALILALTIYIQSRKRDFV